MAGESFYSFGRFQNVKQYISAVAYGASVIVFTREQAVRTYIPGLLTWTLEKIVQILVGVKYVCCHILGRLG